MRLAHPYLIYHDHVDAKMYIEALGGLSFSTKIRKAVAWDIKIQNGLLDMDELEIEKQSAVLSGRPFLFIPPPILLHMIEFLCSRHVDMVGAQTALCDLENLVYHDHDEFVPEFLRDISWEILGICQQISGNLQTALYCYRNSIRQYPCNRIHHATIQRIQDLDVI